MKEVEPLATWNLIEPVVPPQTVPDWVQFAAHGWDSDRFYVHNLGLFSTDQWNSLCLFALSFYTMYACNKILWECK